MSLTLEQARNAHAAGATSEEAFAAEFGVSTKTAERWLDRVDPDRPKSRRGARKITDAQLERLFELAREDVPTTWIAEDIGMSAHVVEFHRNRAGIPYTGEYRTVWPSIRFRPELVALHRQFAPNY